MTGPERLEAVLDTGAERRRARRRHRLTRVGVYAGAVAFALVAALPFVWGGITSFKANQDLYDTTNNPFVYNIRPTAEHVLYLFEETPFPTFLANTAFVGALVVVITLVLAVPASYALARLPVRWGGALGIAIFFVYLVPPSLLFISLSRLVAGLGLQDSKWSLVLVYPTITVPVSVWLLIGFFRSIPRDLEEQAMVDGYSRLAAFAHIA
ncbi:MAG TPA: carbohydrate ABC transporter permease, partial [Acidimicrobiales bacterium]|nr:carbohydrate ABC transporter permease [Acidimicrobiales bacterium]